MSNTGAHKQDIRCLKENTLWSDNVLKFWIPSCHPLCPCWHMEHVVPSLLQLPWQREMSLPAACSGRGQQDRLEPAGAWDLQGCSSQAKTLPWADPAVAKPLLRDEVSAWRQQSCRGRAQPLHPHESHQSCCCAQEHLFLRDTERKRHLRS